MAWYQVFPSADEANNRVKDRSSILIKIKGKLIMLARFNGKFFASENECPHQGYSLNEGPINYLGEVVCPWHSYRFNLKTGQEAGNNCRDLTTYEVKVDDEGLFINLDL